MTTLQLSPGSGASPNRMALRAALLALLVGASAVRLLSVLEGNPMDAVASDAARHWVSGIRPLDPSPMTAIDPVLYQIYLATLAKLTAGQPLLVAYWTALLSLVGPWLWYRFLRELLPDREVALSGWVLLSALPSWVTIYSHFMQETLMLPLLGLALWMTMRCRRKGGTRAFVIALGCWLAAGLTRGICLPLAAVALGWLWLQQPDKGRRVVASVVLLLLILAPLAGRSWTIMRVLSPHGWGQLAAIYQLSGAKAIEVEFTRSAGRERWNYRFVSPAADDQPLMPLASTPTARDGVLRFSIDLDAGARDWQAVRASLPPLTLERYLSSTGENLIHLMVADSWPDRTGEGVLVRVSGLMRWIWLPLLAGCIVLGALRWRALRAAPLVPALVLTWLLMQGLYPLAPNEGRYRKPVEGLLICQVLWFITPRRRAVSGAASLPIGRTL